MAFVEVPIVKVNDDRVVIDTTVFRFRPEHVVSMLAYDRLVKVDDKECKAVEFRVAGSLFITLWTVKKLLSAIEKAEGKCSSERYQKDMLSCMAAIVEILDGRSDYNRII